jgi:aspartate aminotransferase
MTGWRIGYGAGPVPLMKAMLKLQSQSTNHPSSIGQAAAIAALDGPQDSVKKNCAIFQSRRDLVVKAFNAIPGISCHNAEGAFYAFASCRGLLGKRTPQGKVIETSNEFEIYLLDSVNVAVLSGEAYGVPGFFRISFASSMEVLQECCDRIARACSELR